MAILVRSWNLFHGNASPPGRRSRLQEMVVLATADRPGVLCLQEIPVWGLEHLAGWSGMQVYPAIARHGVWPLQLAGWVTRLHNGLLRSALTGQANAILVDPVHEAENLDSEQINEQGRERRVCQAVRVDGTTIVVNTHLSSAGSAQSIELARALEFAERLALPGNTIVLAGDFNVVAPRLDRYSAPGAGIDHILVRGAPAGELVVWPDEQRRQNGVVLSDHSPVELLVG